MYLELNCGASMKTVNPGAFGVFPSSKPHFDGPHNTGPCISISKVSHHSSPTIVGQVIYIYMFVQCRNFNIICNTVWTRSCVYMVGYLLLLSVIIMNNASFYPFQSSTGPKSHIPSLIPQVPASMNERKTTHTIPPPISFIQGSP